MVPYVAARETTIALLLRTKRRICVVRNGIGREFRGNSAFGSAPLVARRLRLIV
jgi:hypothetical protein